MGSNNHLEKLSILGQALGEYDYVSLEPEAAFYCPRCHHRKKKLMINLDKNVYKCWVCGDKFSGSVITLFSRIHKYDLAIEYKKIIGAVSLDQDLKELLQNAFSKKVDTFVETTIKLPEEFKNINGGFESLRYKNYLFSRGINSKLIQKYNIKYCDTGMYKNRVIIPSFNIEGKFNFFIARSIYPHKAKYLNPDIDKNKIIFNELFIDWNTPIIIVEGPFDAIKVDYNCIPLLGSSIGNSLIKEKILKYKPKIYFMLDNDAYNKQIDMIEKLIEWDIEVNTVKIEQYKDPASMSRDQIFNAIQNSKTVNMMSLMKEKITI
jgi:DNA primase